MGAQEVHAHTKCVVWQAHTCSWEEGWRIVVGLVSDLLGLSLSSGVYAAALDCAVSMVCVFVLGTVFGHILTSRAVVKPEDQAVPASGESHRVQ